MMGTVTAGAIGNRRDPKLTRKPVITLQISFDGLRGQVIFVDNAFSRVALGACLRGNINGRYIRLRVTGRNDMVLTMAIRADRRIGHPRHGLTPMDALQINILNIPVAFPAGMRNIDAIN